MNRSSTTEWGSSVRRRERVGSLQTSGRYPPCAALGCCSRRDDHSGRSVGRRFGCDGEGGSPQGSVAAGWPPGGRSGRAAGAGQSLEGHGGARRRWIGGASGAAEPKRRTRLLGHPRCRPCRIPACRTDHAECRQELPARLVPPRGHRVRRVRPRTRWGISPGCRRRGTPRDPGGPTRWHPWRGGDQGHRQRPVRPRPPVRPRCGSHALRSVNLVGGRRGCRRRLEARSSRHR